MKKCLWIWGTICLVALSACSNVEKEPRSRTANEPSSHTANEPPSNTTNEPGDRSMHEPGYRIMEADWPAYFSTQELVQAANVVFTGKITDISFAVLDLDALPATEETEERHRYLHTMYTVETIDQYKGDVDESVQVRIMGGIKDYKTDDQMSLLNETEQEWGIPLLAGSVPYTIGETYLFVLYQFETGAPTVLNLDQSVYALNDPFNKQKAGVKAFKDPARYYAESADEAGNGIISAMDIIRAFGEDKWVRFWTNWQAENPDWKTRLDPEAVEKPLAANQTAF